jgi:hypothetical protein
LLQRHTVATASAIGTTAIVTSGEGVGSAEIPKSFLVPARPAIGIVPALNPPPCKFISILPTSEFDVEADQFVKNLHQREKDAR